MTQGNKKSTKELILETAFSFLNEIRYDTFSMNELAAKVGISKPAIYRHFKNKEAVLDAMEERIVEEIAPFLKISFLENKEISGRAVAGLIHCFIENPAYINYFIACLSSTPNYEEKLFNRLYEKGVPFAQKYFLQFKSDMNLFSSHVFCGMSIFFFVKIQEMLKNGGHIAQTPQNYGEKIVDLLNGGLRGTTESESPLHPDPISESRKQELLELCRINPEIFPKENRIFTALASVIEKYKMPGVTVERIADELHMAKSSLYEYFDNKNQMIRTLIEKELLLLETILIENTTEARNFTEYVYIVMFSELEYFTHRPSIIPICGWLLMSGGTVPQDDDCDRQKRIPWEKRLPDRVEKPDLGFPYSPELITEWIKCLPVSFLVEAKGKQISEEKRMEGFMHTIDFILNGINETKQMEEI